MFLIGLIAYLVGALVIVDAAFFRAAGTSWRQYMGGVTMVLGGLTLMLIPS